MSKTQTYIALLRGINVGGHHKVPMADLKKLMAEKGFSNVITILNSGNVIFDGKEEDIAKLEVLMGDFLEEKFGFPIPTLIRTREEIEEIIASDPFKDVEVTKDIRLYVSFLKEKTDVILDLPLISDDGSYEILDVKQKDIFSVLDVSVNGTPKGMEILEKLFGKGITITTRNMKTLIRIQKKLVK